VACNRSGHGGWLRRLVRRINYINMNEMIPHKINPMPQILKIFNTLLFSSADIFFLKIFGLTNSMNKPAPMKNALSSKAPIC
jgi:hypothetical protein